MVLKEYTSMSGMSAENLATMPNFPSAAAVYARQFESAVDWWTQMRTRIRARRQDHPAVEVVERCRLPELPSDCTRIVYAHLWRAEAHDRRAEARDRAACLVQRAVRRAIRRAQGDPWDLPELIDDNQSDDLFHLCFGTLLRSRIDADSV